jgi:hypothetical protein
MKPAEVKCTPQYTQARPGAKVTLAPLGQVVLLASPLNFMQREALLTNVSITIRQSTKRCEKFRLSPDKRLIAELTHQ